MAAFFSIAAAASAAPQLTTIQDTLYKADGTLMNASAVITWNSFTASDGSQIGVQSLTVQIVNGSMYVQLIPTTTASPAAPYTVTYSSNGIFQFQETWMVPPSATALHVADVRTGSTTIPSGGGTGNTGGNTSNIPEANVTGLVSDLAARPVKGPSFGTGRVALIDANGTVNTVVGNVGDCVFVDGSTGPCGTGGTTTNYTDGETPAGVVDGVNNSFVLAGTPSPAASLLLTRNGMMMKAGFDYTLTTATLAFSAGATPQPGDTLIAWYRTAPVAGLMPAPLMQLAPATFRTTMPQVACSSAGSTTSSTTLSILGSCTLPAGFLDPGDRVELHFTLTHGGTANGFTFQINWGSATLIQRTAGPKDAIVAGRGEASIMATGAQLTGESFGTLMTLLPTSSVSTDSINGSIAIQIQANLPVASSDVINLVNFTVVRYPAISNP